MVDIEDYSQPDFYRFNDDSTWLVESAIQHSDLSRVKNVLDICAGSGVVGIEFALRANVETLDFVEIQKDFIPYIELNKNKYLPSIQSNIFLNDISTFSVEKKYDLILSNPPYFEKGSGLAPDDKRRELCRFADKSFEDNLLLKGSELLAPNGKMFFLSLRPHPELKKIGTKKRISIFLFEGREK